MRFVQSVSIVPAIAAIVAFAALSGCEQQALETRASQAALAGDTTPLDEIAREGAIDCPIICVSNVAKDSKSHAGRVAVRGVVSKVYPERRAFTVANIVEGATCCASGCGHDSIPARVPEDLYPGDLPRELDRVILVGEVVPNGEGYDFVIEEVWARGELVLRRQG